MFFYGRVACALFRGVDFVGPCTKKVALLHLLLPLTHSWLRQILVFWRDSLHRSSGDNMFHRSRVGFFALISGAGSDAGAFPAFLITLVADPHCDNARRSALFACDLRPYSPSFLRGTVDAML